MSTHRARIASAFLAALGITTLAAQSAWASAQETETAKASVLHTAVVVVNYTDEDAQVSQEQRTSIEDRIFGDSESVHSFYSDASRGDVAVEPVEGEDPVLGPFDIPMAGNCDDYRGPLVEHATKALEDNGIAENEYQRLSIIYPNHERNCDGGSAYGQMPGKVTWFPDTFLAGDASMFTHEYGHNFGFNHVETVRCADGGLEGCEATDYGSATVMGAGGYVSGLTAPEVMSQEWLPADAVEEIGGDAAADTYTLRPLHAKADVEGGRALVVDTGTDGVQLIVAYRENGNTVDTETDEGVQLSLVKDGALMDADLVDATPDTEAKDADLPAGQSIELPDGRTVETVSAEAGEAKVRIS